VDGEERQQLGPLGVAGGAPRRRVQVEALGGDGLLLPLLLLLAYHHPAARWRRVRRQRHRRGRRQRRRRRGGGGEDVGVHGRDRRVHEPVAAVVVEVERRRRRMRPRQLQPGRRRAPPLLQLRPPRRRRRLLLLLLRDGRHRLLLLLLLLLRRRRCRPAWRARELLHERAERGRVGLHERGVGVRAARGGRLPHDPGRARRRHELATLSLASCASEEQGEEARREELGERRRERWVVVAFFKGQKGCIKGEGIGRPAGRGRWMDGRELDGSSQGGQGSFLPRKTFAQLRTAVYMQAMLALLPQP
jgi:hypothetical protein